MNQWLFIIKLTRLEILTSGPTAEEAALVGAHFAYWQKLTQAGQALVVGRTQTTTPDTLGLAIFRAEDETAARQICEADPAVVGGVFTMTVQPYKVALVGDPEPFKP